MGLYDIFTGRSKKLQKRAELLFPAIKMASIAAYIPSVKIFPELESVDIKDWDFFLPVASSYAALIGLMNLKISNKLKEDLSRILEKSLDEWSPEWNRALNDCTVVSARTIETLPMLNDNEKITAISDSIGIWVVLNLLKHFPETDSEKSLIRPIGSLATHTFINWWYI